MFLEERQEAILAMLEHDGKVKVKELSELFDVTEDCIRKDLGSLEKQGNLKRTYGGAVVLRQNLHNMEVSKRRNTDVDAKRKIAQAAVNLIHEKDMVFLDISTSNLEIAALLAKQPKDVTVVTNMIEILVILAQNPKIKVLFAGGTINKSRDGFWGGMTLDFISRLKPDIAFVGAVGVDIRENSVSTYDIEDGINKAAIIQVSKKAYLVAAMKKMSNDGNYNYVTLDALTGIITDSVLTDELHEIAAGYGVEIIMPYLQD
ncbi:transcriptional regulator, DeoR family [Propionispira arboris]|uniref:Transcriptional regulator, DeoR family n=1 Tax=Propionispira arboris TaxID=84035 RepID=A0A1H6TGX0_9FIRM|nr:MULTISPECIES: DeoR/GlpR family DNA-binding transcription regulator [Propionispira]SEI79261.1 transcriptional regulator, DeoR family [Propionispira arboris]